MIYSSKLLVVAMATMVIVTGLLGLQRVTMTMPWQPFQTSRASHLMMQSGFRLVFHGGCLCVCTIVICL